MATSPNGVRFVTALLVATAVAGCAGPLSQVARLADTTYQADTLDARTLPASGVAVLLASSPALLGQWRQSASDVLVRVLRAEGPGLRVMSWEETLSRINADGLTQAYAEMLRTYEVTGILEKDPLRQVGHSLSVRYLAQPALITFRQDNNVRLSILGLRLSETREATVRGRLQIWDAVEAQLVWAGEGEATLAGEEIRSRPVSFEVIRFVWQDLVRRLLSGHPSR